jgi:glycosyltransferase involved in cell wall biosynthesis
MKNQPKVSIMTLAYNCQDFLSEAISSIQEQSFEDWELIIIDDHSSDKTAEIAKQFAAENERVRYFRNEENLGIPRGRNRALKEACGEYIAVLDSDDIWLSEKKLQRQVEFLDTHPEHGVVGTWTRNIDNDGEITGDNKTPQNDEFIRRTFFWKNQIVNSSSLFRKKAVANVGGYDNTFAYSQDMELWLALGKDWKLANLPHFWTAYRSHDKNVSLKKRNAQLEQNIRALRKHRDFYPWSWTLWFIIPLKKFYITIEPTIRPLVSRVRRLLSW